MSRDFWIGLVLSVLAYAGLMTAVLHGKLTVDRMTARRRDEVEKDARGEGGQSD